MLTLDIMGSSGTPALVHAGLLWPQERPSCPLSPRRARGLRRFPRRSAHCLAIRRLQKLQRGHPLRPGEGESERKFSHFQNSELYNAKQCERMKEMVYVCVWRESIRFAGPPFT
jgi:hypothetical protein